MSEYEKLKEFVDAVLSTKEPLFGGEAVKIIPKKTRKFNP